MTLLTSSAAFNVVATLVSIVAVVLAYFKWKFTYWEKRGLKLAEDPVIPFGNSSGLLTGQKTFGEQFQDYYNKLKSKGLAHGGAYLALKPFYIPVDTELIKNIIQKDFQHFVNHGTYIDEKTDPLSGHLFNLEDSKWKNMRVKLTPTFTSGKMKMMFQTLVDCTVGLREIMDDAANTSQSVDIKDILGRFTTDIIGSCAFGLECNSLKDPEAEFRKYGKRVFDNTILEQIIIVLPFILPHRLLSAFGYRSTKRDVEDFFMKAVESTVKYREKNNIYRKDFMHLLLQIKNRGKVTDDDKITADDKLDSDNADKMTMNELGAQAFVFFLAGFETSSTTMNFALYELAENPDIQKKLRNEINNVLAKHNNEITYDAVNEMTYLENVINETLRKYPPVPVLFRKCTKDYVVPGTSIIIQKGTDVAISSLGLHKDPDNFPDPEKFDPDRYTDEVKSTRNSIAWIPFGEGPRICIGLRFGMLQSKIGILTLLRNYEITLSKKTKTPLEYDKTSFITAAKGGVWLDVKKITQ